MGSDSSLDTALDLPVPVLSNQMLIRLMDAKKITITPFSAKRLGATSYQLCPYTIRFNVEDEDGFLIADQTISLRSGAIRDLRPGEYAIVSPKERIFIEEGFVADFFPSSWCIENRLLLTVGRLDAGYKADLVFGVFNAGRADVRLTSEFQLARVSFGWLGRQNLPVYGRVPPGAYIPQLQELRKREEEILNKQEQLSREKQELGKLRAALLHSQNEK